MMTTEETAWDSLSYAGKNHILFERQKHLLEEFLVRNAISREQYEKKTMDEGVSASFLNEWNGSRNHREKIYFSYDSAGFGDEEFYPTKEEKGARLGYTLISNHAFVDGNKRIGVYIMLSFLEMNGIRLQCTDDELVDIGLSVASSRMRYEELLQWVLDHKA